MNTYDPERLAELSEACVSVQGNHNKGEALADLVQYVMEQVPGVQLIERSHVLPDGSAEVDLIFRNAPYVSLLPIHGVTLFVECKNEARRIKAEQVRVFGSKLGERNQRIGVMVSRLGLSGSRSSHGHAVVSRELALGRSIVILTLEDLAALSTSADFISLFGSRLLELEINATYTSV